MERYDLTEYMVNKDKPNGDESYGGWGAGGQLHALRFYLDKKVKILDEYDEGGYQGEMFAVLKFGRRIVLWRDYFGSCSGCDGLEGENGYEYIKNTLQEGNTRQFTSLKKAREYIARTEDWLWESGRYPIVSMLNKLIGDG